FLVDVPFHVVHNHGMVRDQYGKKMSKSFGNVVDPLEFIDRYGADALRFALFQHCSPGQDVPLAEEWVDGGRRFANKLWNMARFVLQASDGTRPQLLEFIPAPALEDRWILSRLEACRAEVDRATSIGTLDWSTAAQALYHFAWDEFADWYLEAAKVRLYGDDFAARDAARRVLLAVLDDLLRLLHPFMPFVTEVLWRALSGADGGQDSLAGAAWPASRGERDRDAEKRFTVLQELVGALRRFRSDHNIPPSRRIEATVVSPMRQVLEPLAPLVHALAGLERLSFRDESPEVAGTARVVSAAGDVFIPLVGAIDVEEELTRMRKELEKAAAERGRAMERLADARFVERAPSRVVVREREKRDEWARVVETLQAEIAELEAVIGESSGAAAP
ncbi:MAG: class I tRNA ligase family protein, partial [Actinomycetota bacterium]|nr:class I tRNA ligase family protein [Actinomycetota bacterium]